MLVTEQDAGAFSVPWTPILTLPVHRRKNFKSSNAELCGKREYVLCKDFVEMLKFVGSLQETKCRVQ